ncbi:MAG: DNA repair protein RecN [Acidobacteriota bacterium]|nr:DNA repair protein RecN [Acidobacteriota bacterium]
MLRQLRIENLVLAREVLLEFAPGLNLITGATGGGKSLMVNALALATGARGDASLIREGADRTVVEAVFDLSRRPDAAERFAHAGYDAADDEVMVRREIARDGRSRAFLSGATITLTMLRRLTTELVELHGQHEPQTLLLPEQHRRILDQLGDHGGLLDAVKSEHAVLHEIGVKLADLVERSSARASRLELTTYKLAELDQVRPQAGEDGELKRERDRLRHAEAIGEALSGALELIYEGEDAAVDRVHAAARRLRSQASHGEEYEELAARLDDVRAQIDDVAEEIRSGVDEIEPDPERLSRIEDRLHALERLRRRFDGAPLADVLATAEAMRQEVDELTVSTGDVARLEEERGRHLAAYRAAAAKLSRARRGAAERLREKVGALLSELAMDKAVIEVSLAGVDAEQATLDDVSPAGTDEVELLLQANPGEPARPLRKVASGGELSRVMLALDVALESGLPRRTLLFDEVDQGVGGEAADRLGEFLARVARHHQVICVTHLPSVAARADVHVTVNKKVKAGRTVAVVKTLEDDGDRIDELARMLGGSYVNETARRHAEALVKTRPARAARPRRSRRLETGG